MLFKKKSYEIKTRVWNKEKSLIKKLLIIVIFFMFCMNVKPVHASQVGIEVNPPLTSILLNNKEDINTTITIKNISRNILTITAVTKGFTVSENGSVKYFASKDEEIFLKNNVTIFIDDQATNTIKLIPNEIKDVKIYINNIKILDNKDYYFSVIFLASNEISNQQRDERKIFAESTMRAGVASHILLSVHPTQKIDNSIEDFSIPELITSRQIPIEVKIENKSNSFIKAKATISITDIFANLVDQIQLLPTYILANSTRDMVSANNNKDYQMLLENISKSSRYNLLLTKNHLLFGAYTARLDSTISNGIQTKNLDAQIVRFFVIPFELFGLIIFSIILLIFIVSRIKQYQKKNS